MRDCLWQKWVSVMELPVNRRTRSTLPDEKARIALRRGSPIDCAIMFWQGTSGHAYVHSIYTLAGCPEIPPACVLLVHRPEYGGPRAVLKVMRVEKERLRSILPRSVSMAHVSVRTKCICISQLGIAWPGAPRRSILQHVMVVSISSASNTVPSKN